MTTSGLKCRLRSRSRSFWKTSRMGGLWCYCVELKLGVGALAPFFFSILTSAYEAVSRNLSVIAVLLAKVTPAVSIIIELSL